MKRHLTDASVQKIKPPKSGVLEVFDLGYPGLALRIGYGGAKSFEVFYRVGGKLKRTTLGRWPEVSLAAAREAWRKTRESIAKGETPPHR
jgi:Arm domain-containing DNA-binding protein